jgi:hypothetical protein
MHKDLRLAGQLPPLDAPHHMRATEWCNFREGVVLSSAIGSGSLLDIGLDKVTYTMSSVRKDMALVPEVKTSAMGRGSLLTWASTGFCLRSHRCPDMIVVIFTKGIYGRLETLASWVHKQKWNCSSPRTPCPCDEPFSRIHPMH